jgi:hypothetical protein
MKKEYFYVLLTNLKIVWDKKLFDNPLWTRDKFSFHVLEKIIPLINNNYLRIYALISWLKSIDIKTNEIIKDKETINNCFKSKDFFLVRNYMKKYKLINGLSKEELIDIKNNFEEYIDCLDIDGILNNYLFIPLTCIICKKEFSSVYEVLEHKNCTNGKYHPPSGSMETCQHKGCFHKSKTVKQRLMHHDKLEIECKAEKNNLFNLLNNFRCSIQNILNLKTDLIEDLERFEENDDLKEEIQKVKNQAKILFDVAIDKDQYKGIISNN